jgi:hypothetical protein
MADKMLYVWIFSLLSLSIAGGIILPVYLISFDFDYSHPQFFDDLYSLNPQKCICDSCNNSFLESKGVLLTEKEDASNKNISHIGKLSEINKRQLYREECKLNYNNVSNILLYLSVTFVIIAAFRSA